MSIDDADYPFARYMDEIAAWYRDIITTCYPKGDDQLSKGLILDDRDRFARMVTEQPDPTPELLAAAVQWNRTVLLLADSEKDQDRPGFKPEWVAVWDYYIDGNDEILGPYGPSGP
ncbi:hypothetical protein [Streptomyces sp. NPDC001205]